MLTLHQKRLLTMIAVASFLIMPLEILHAVGWVIFHIYELLEFLLDEVIHHTLHTSRHTTQVIVFYLMIAIALYGSYRIVRVVRSVCQKEKIIEFFNPVSLSKKNQMIFGVTFGVAFLAIAVF